MSLQDWPRLRYLTLTGVLLLPVGCGPARDVSAPATSSPYIAARDGGFSYRIPSGWFDASADSQACGHAALLIRNDYGATIAVDEVRLDATARAELQRNGLVPVAQLLLSLSSWEHDAILVIAPHRIAVGGRPACRYVMTSGNSKDTVEVTLVENRGRLYTVNVLVSGRSAGDTATLQSVQEGFLGTMRW